MRDRARLALVVLLLSIASVPAYAEKQSWNHAANIKDAAERLAVLHRKEGSPGVLKFLDACYRTHLLASDFNRGLEACMAQDYMHTQVLASIYARLPEDQRAKSHAPTAQQIEDGMKQRFSSAFSQYKFSVSEAEDFKKLVDKQGFPVFLKAIFPKAADQPGKEPQPADKK